MFFGRWLVAGPWVSIFADVDRFWVPWGCHLASKWARKTRSEKRLKKGGSRKRGTGGGGSLKGLESSNQQLADGSQQLAASRMAIGMEMGMRIGMGMGMRMVGMGMRMVSKAQERPSWPAARWRTLKRTVIHILPEGSLECA